MKKAGHGRSFASSPFGVKTAKRRISKSDDGEAAGELDEALRRGILAIPPGKVSTYGRVAEAAGYPRYHRAVARVLRQMDWDLLPWHRVLAADGKLKTSGSSLKEQRARLRLEGVVVKNDRVDLSKFLF